MNSLKILSAIVGALTPLLYFHGQSYHSGWLSFWGLPPDLFPISLESALIYGFLTYTVLGIQSLLVLFMYLIVAVGMVYNANEMYKYKWVKRTIAFMTSNKEKSFDPGHPFLSSALGVFGKLMIVILFMLLFLFLVIDISQQASVLGKDSAEKKYQELVGNKQSLSIEFGMNRYQGNFITCSESFCGVLVNGEVELVQLSNGLNARWAVDNETEH